MSKIKDIPPADLDKYTPIIYLGIGAAVIWGIAKMFSKPKPSNRWIKRAQNRYSPEQVQRWRDLAENLNTALNKGLFWGLSDDEDLVYQTISRFGDNTDAIEVAGAYTDITGKDLISQFQTDLSASERKKIAQILNARNITAWNVAL